MNGVFQHRWHSKVHRYQNSTNVRLRESPTFQTSLRQRRYVLCTIHRVANAPLEQLLPALCELSTSNVSEATSVPPGLRISRQQQSLYVQSSYSLTMTSQTSQSASFKVYARWRPLGPNEAAESEVERTTGEHGSKQSISLASHSRANRSQSWKSGSSFTKVFTSEAINQNVFEKVVAPTLPQVMGGATCNFFAYGHTGSGKTHTIIGYNYEDEDQLGLCLSTARDLFRAINDINIQLEANEQEEKDQLGVAVRIYEVRGKYAYDLMNNGIECHVREGPDGQTHIRGQTEMLEDGKVRVRPIVATPCWSFDELRKTVLSGLNMRKVGSSSVHSESSRTHAILEFEVVTRALLELRDAVIERESELVPVGKRATDIYLEEHQKSLIKTSEGKYMMNPDCPLNQARIDEAEAEKNKYEARQKAAEDQVTQYLETSQHSCLGGKFVFVDLAGSEYFDQGTLSAAGGPKQTPQERQQGRQINTDLFALKEVIRARALNQARVPFRSSPLTMVLRSHFLSTNNGQSAMILTVSPSEAQYAATVNTLKYGNLVRVAGGT